MTFNLMKVLSRSTSSPSSTSQAPPGHHTTHSHAEHHKHAPLPFLASPVDPEALKWVRNKKRNKGSVQRTKTVKQFEHESETTDSGLANRIFRKQHEASTLELFFDLFFVGNLAVFTTKSAHVDVKSLTNYIGFFAILWTTWFHISMYDVRFYVDSVFTRFCKFLAFGIMVSFVGLSPMYQAILTDGTSRAFQGIALLLFSSRMLFLIQYAIVLWFVREFDKTLVPMLLTMCVYILSGVGFLASWLEDRGVSSLNGSHGAHHVRVWYGIIVAEAVAVIAIACTFRILSFKHTHLVERIGLLTLIIMGEGIIGLVKSTSYAVQGTAVTVWQETGIVAAGVLLIYLIYVLYFDNIDHHRFGTIGQQIWTLLHFPAHVAILLTVEGSSGLVIWNACRSAIAWICEDRLPSLTDPGAKYLDQTQFLAAVNETYYEAAARFYYKDLKVDYYPKFPEDYDKLKKINATYNTDAWKAQVTPVLEKMNNYYQYFIYQNFGAEGPYEKLKKSTDYGEKVQLFEDGFKFTLMYFYVAAGALLFIFALLFWFGRRHKTRTEWISIGVRIFSGMCLPIMLISPLTEKNDDAFRFTYAALLIPIVAIAFLVVIVVDNIVKAISERHYTIIEERRKSRHSTYQSGDASPKEEAQELTSEDSSYEMHKNQHLRMASDTEYQHGTPELVNRGFDDDTAPLTQDMQKTPIVSFGQLGQSKGYAQVEQMDAEDDITEYHGSEPPRHFRTDSMRRHESH